MLLFWCLLSVMLIIALSFLFLPLFLSNKSQPLDHPALTLYRQQWRELHQQFQIGEITDREFEQSKAELEQAALNHQFKTPLIITRKISFPFLLFLSLLVCITALALYKWLGDSQGLGQWYVQKQQQALAKNAISEYGSVENIISALHEKLQAHPESAEGWYLLGKLYLNQQQYSLAAQALSKANHLKSHDVTIMETYAESAFFANKQRLPSYLDPLVKQILQLNPNDINAMNLIAMDAYQRKHYQIAIEYWEKILPLVGNESDEGKAVLSMLNQAQQHLAVNLPVINLLIHIKFSEQLKTKILKNAVLFVYAKAVSGPPMPLAVKRFSMNAVPHEITLGNSDAMMPTLRLSNFNAVQIIARISQSGQALPAQGDWQVVSAVINPVQQKKPIELEFK